MFIYIQKQTSSTSNTALHDGTLIKLNVARSVAKGSFLIKYSNGHAK